MPRQALAEDMIRILAGRPEVTKVHKEQSPCGRCRKRVKIVRGSPAKLTFCVTEPDHPRYAIEVETKKPVDTAMWMESYLRREGVDVVNR